MKRISVVIPSAKADRLLAKAIESVLDQGNVDFECIVVLGEESEDTPQEITTDDSRIRVIRTSSNSPVASIQAGLDNVQGEIVGILSSDDMYHPGALEAVLKHFDQHSEDQIVYGKADFIDESNQRQKGMRILPPTLERLQEHSCLCSSATFYRASLFQTHGSFDPQYQYWMAYEFWIRMAQANVPFGAIRETIAGKRVDAVIQVAGDGSEVREMQASREVISMLRVRLGSPGNGWPLRDGCNRAQRLGHDRITSTDFDRKTLAFAWSHVVGDTGTQWQRATRFSKLLLRHVKTEINQLLKRPKFAYRFLPSRIRYGVGVLSARRFFQLRFAKPVPCKLPAAYFKPISLDNAPKISIATPNLNQGKFIERTILSVLQQDYPNLEFVIQDGCSKDESLGVIRKYEHRLTAWRSVKDRGQSHAINLALKRTTGNIMAYLNSDDILLPGCLAYVAKFFHKHPEVDVVYGDRLLIDENDFEINRWILPAHDDDAITWADYVPQETLFWRRSAWDAVGGTIDETFQFAMDWDLILRFRAAGLKFAHLPRLLGAFRITDGQKTNQLIASVGRREMELLRHRELGRIPCEREVAQHIRRYIKRQRHAERLQIVRDRLTELIVPAVPWTCSPSSDCQSQNGLREAI